MQLGAVDLVIIVVYVAMLPLVGVYATRRQKTTAEYFLGGRRLHWFFAGSSALVISSASFLYVPGEMIRYGVPFFAGAAALPLVIPTVTRIVLPIVRVLPITSVYEYLARRFAPRLAHVAEAVFVLRVSLWMAIIIYTAGVAVSEVTGWDIYATIVGVGVFTTIYTTLGGFNTVVWTDNLQTLLLLIGASCLPLVVWSRTGLSPVAWWDLFSQANRTHIELFSLDPTVRMTLFGVVASQFFWTSCLNASDQVIVQRWLATPSLEASRRSVWVATLLQMLIVSMLGFCGVALFAAYWQRSGLPVAAFQHEVAADADRLLPRFIAEGLPRGVSGLLLASLLAAAMSNLSSGINSVSTVLSRHVGGIDGESDRRRLRAAKTMAWLTGAFVTLVTCGLAVAMTHTDWNLLELSSRIGGLFVGPLGVLFFAGMLFPRVGATAIAWGFAASLAASTFIAFGKELFGLRASISFLWIVPVPFVSGMTIAAILGRFLTPPLPEQIAGLSRGSLVPREDPSSIVDGGRL